VPVVANFTADVPDGADQILRALECAGLRVGPLGGIDPKLIALGFTDFVECGPGGVIAGLAARIDPAVTCLSLETHADIVKHADALLSS
jgi:hypothetical protein